MKPFTREEAEKVQAEVATMKISNRQAIQLFTGVDVDSEGFRLLIAGSLMKNKAAVTEEACCAVMDGMLIGSYLATRFGKKSPKM